jgi:L-serine deaminase
MSYAAGETALNTSIKPSFSEVPIDAENNISTQEFLDAAEGLTKIFDLMGSAAFSPVQSDITGNVKKLRTRYDADTANLGTIQKIVKADYDEAPKNAKTGRPDKAPSASDALLWLTR